MIEVSESGCGMAPEVAARVVELLRTKRESEETGFGLSKVFGSMK